MKTRNISFSKIELFIIRIGMILLLIISFIKLLKIELTSF